MLTGFSKSAGVDIDCRNSGDASGSECCHGYQTNHSAADHDGRAGRCLLAAQIHRMQANGQWLKQGRHREVEAVGNRIADPGRHDCIFGKAAVPTVVTTGDPKHLPVAAEVFTAIAALLATATENS